jgi:hypothetical protein
MIDYPHVNDFGKTIRPNSETFISVRAEITTADEQIANIHVVKVYSKQ